MKNGHEMFHHAGSSLRFPNEKGNWVKKDS